jgi:hypothetical protein
MKKFFRGSRAATLLIMFGLGAGTTGCDALLDVDNPATFGDEDLNDPLLAANQVNGVVARFQAMYDDVALFGAILSDEAVSGHNFETIQRVDRRMVDKLNTGDVYDPLSRTRAAADSAEARLTRVLADSAGRDLGIAKIQAYGSLTYTLMGEYLCEAPLDPTKGAVSSDSMFKVAISRSAAAIRTATAGRLPSGPVSRADSTLRAARADSLVNLARVSAARAHLNLGNKTEAAALAALVPSNFEVISAYNVANSNNVFQASTTGANRNLGVDVAFRNLNDPRVRHSSRDSTGHDQLTRLFTPRLAPSFGGYSLATAGSFTLGTSIRISSGLEAQYILAEAQGLNAANLAFVNARRAVGGQAALGTTTTAAEFLAALQDQRRRDFFLDGHRLGDLRRYKRLYGQNLFPTGPHPTPGRGDYGTSECFVPSNAEIVGNPGY